MKTINEITLYDLMAEDLDVHLTINKRIGFDLTIDDENGEELVNDQAIHPYAMESLAEFCRRYLVSYDKVA